MVSEMSDPNDKSFNWKNIVKKYRNLSNEHELLNLYKWVVGCLSLERITKSNPTFLWLSQQTKLAVR